MSRRLTSRAGRYVVAATASLLAIAATRVAAPVVGSSPFFALLYASVTVVAWFSGFAPALLTTAISAAAAAFFLLPVADWPANEDAGRLALFVGVAMLISLMTAGRKRAEQSLRELLAREKGARTEAEAANRAKDVLLATVSHELRTPLQSILGWAHVLRSRSTDPAIRQAVETIERSAKTQATLVGDLLDVSRIVAGKLSLELRPISLQAVVGAALEALRPAADAKEIGIDYRPAATPALVMGDAARLQQVVGNLISNAVKFTPAGGRVTVRLRADGPVTLTVTDTGKGISPEFLPRLFDPFSQAEEGGRHGGLGLGLAIVKHLVELHGGTVQAESAGPGRGATFMVKLPVLAHRALAALPIVPRAVSEGVSPVLSGIHVLLVEDELEARMLLAAVLEGHGARVAAVSSAREALAVLDDGRPDVIVSDIGLPDQDGRTFIRHVRAREESRSGQLPAVALTARAGREEEEQSLAAGFQLHLAKPAEPMELVAAVATLARQRD